jgi:uncharacterized protein
MERLAMKDLEDWAASPCRKPLIVGGARQVGKTWLVKEFGRTHYDAVALCRLPRRRGHAVVSSTTRWTPNVVLTAIGAYTATNPSDGKTLVFLDDIQECPRAIASLKMLCEERPDVPIVAAGSFARCCPERERRERRCASRRLPAR